MEMLLEGKRPEVIGEPALICPIVTVEESRARKLTALQMDQPEPRQNGQSQQVGEGRWKDPEGAACVKRPEGNAAGVFSLSQTKESRSENR